MSFFTDDQNDIIKGDVYSSWNIMVVMAFSELSVVIQDDHNDCAKEAIFRAVACLCNIRHR